MQTNVSGELEMIDELISRIVANVGIDQALASKSVAMILAFLKKDGPEEDVKKLMDAIPGSEELAATEAGAKGGLMGSVMGMMPGGGGVMALGTQLMGAGLGMGQIQAVSKEVFQFGKEKAGEDTMGAIVGGVPGLSQFV